MKHEILEIQGIKVVALQGDVDLQTSPAAREILLKCLDATRKVIVDLTAVTYIDSSGVASLIEALQASKKDGGQFVLAAASEPTRRVLELGRLDKVFTMYDSIEEGVRACVTVPPS